MVAARCLPAAGQVIAPDRPARRDTTCSTLPSDNSRRGACRSVCGPQFCMSAVGRPTPAEIRRDRANRTSYTMGPGSPGPATTESCLPEAGGGVAGTSTSQSACPARVDVNALRAYFSLVSQLSATLCWRPAGFTAGLPPRLAPPALNVSPYQSPAAATLVDESRGLGLADDVSEGRGRCGAPVR